MRSDQSESTEEQKIFRELERERRRHEGTIARLLSRASAVRMYVPGANPFLYPGCFRGPFRAER